MKIVLLTALWGRTDIARACLEWHRDLVDDLKLKDIDLRLLVVASTNEDYALGVSCGWAAIKRKNDPLGHKWNSVVEAVPTVYGDDVDAVLMIGSDDFMTPFFIADAVHKIREGAEYASPRTMYMVDGATSRAVKFRGNLTIGAGRIVSTSILAPCQFRPWESALNSGLDRSFDRTMRIIEAARENPLRFSVIEDDGLMTIKTEVNIWSFDYILARTLSDKADAEKLYGVYPAVFDNIFHRGVD